jgi:DNA-binding LytR/AlgR family response regulator
MWRKIFDPQYRTWQWAFCVATSLYVFLFVLLCEPFKSEEIPYSWLSNQAFIEHSILDFLTVASSCAVPLIFFPKYFPKYFSAENLTRPKLAFLILVMNLWAVTGNFFSNHFYFFSELTVSYYLLFLFKVTIPILLFSVLPFFYLFIRTFNYFTTPKEERDIKAIDYILQTSTTTDKSEILISNSKFEEKGTPQYKTIFDNKNDEKSDVEPQMLRFNDTSNKKSLTISVNNLYYITSAQNYIEVFYQNKNAMQSRQILRNSLKAIEEEMILNDENSPLIRCHKAFIVNREKVVELRGPAKLAQFILKDIDTTIPVSRQKYAELGTQFSAPNNNS